MEAFSIFKKQKWAYRDEGHKVKYFFFKVSLKLTKEATRQMPGVI
jgi:hypothetical protein